MATKELLARRLEALQRMQTEVQMQLESVERFPDEDPFEDGAVLWFEKQFVVRPNGKKYTYVVVKAGGNWYTSGPQGGGHPRTWYELVQFMSSGVEEVYMISSWEKAF